MPRLLQPPHDHRHGAAASACLLHSDAGHMRRKDPEDPGHAGAPITKPLCLHAGKPGGLDAPQSVPGHVAAREGGPHGVQPVLHAVQPGVLGGSHMFQREVPAGNSAPKSALAANMKVSAARSSGASHAWHDMPPTV